MTAPIALGEAQFKGDEPSRAKEMTAEEMAAVDAEYARLPGTPPDGWSFIDQAEMDERGHAAMRERLATWQPEMTWARWTRTHEGHLPEYPRGVWLEVWKERPFKEATFSPPLTLGGNRKDGSSPKETDHA